MFNLLQDGNSISAMPRMRAGARNREMHPLIVTLAEMLPEPVIETIETFRKMNKRQVVISIESLVNFAS